MQIKIFTIPASDHGPDLTELNHFLDKHNVKDVEQKFIENDTGSYWSFCVRYHAGAKKTENKVADRSSLFAGISIFVVIVAIGFYFVSKPKAPQKITAATVVNVNPADSNENKYLSFIDAAMVPVSGGDFIMGSDKTANERPSHNVHVNDFKILKNEVTKDLWNKIMPHKAFSDSGDLLLPANDISWNDANAFVSALNNLNRKHGDLKYVYALPAETQWEYAFVKGNTVNKSINEQSWNRNNSGGKLHAVATKVPNALGIYDMLGNVYEWCADDFKLYDSGTTKFSGKILRGGDCFNDVYFVDGKIRNMEYPDKSSQSLGFRVVKYLK